MKLIINNEKYHLNDYYKSDFLQKGQELAKSNPRKLFTLKTE